MSIKSKAYAWLAKQFQINDADAYHKEMALFGGSGSSPTADNAMKLSVVWSCVKILSETIATLPLLVYERGPNDRRKVARSHPLYTLLHDSPNADMTSVDFLEMLIAHVALRGNAYVRKSYSGTGAARRLIALDPLDPDLMRKPYRNRNGVVRFDYSDPTGLKEWTDAEVWHIRGFGTNPLFGMSVIEFANQSIKGASSAERAAAEIFGNGMKPGAVVTIKEVLKPDQRAQVKAKMQSDIFGDNRTGQVQLLEGGAEYKQLTINPVDAQLVETRAANIEDLCRWFGVPPAMIGHGGTVSNWGTGREQIMLGFLTMTLRPYLVRIEKGISKWLMAPGERIRFFAEFSVEGLLRADSEARVRVQASQVQNGLKTRNECRALENDEPLDGGDELTVQSNLVPIKMLGETPATPTAAAATP
jgi:HK97 family phage portal protein